MRMNLQAEPTFRTICMIGRDEAKSLLNIFDCMMDNEGGYSDLEDILDYRIDNLLGNIDQVKAQLERYVAKKQEERFQARLDSRVDDQIRANKQWSSLIRG